MQLLTQDRLALIQELNRLIFKFYGIEKHATGKGGKGKTKSNARHTSIGMIYNNLNCRQVDICAAIGVSVGQCHHSLRRFDEKMDWQDYAIEVNQVWVEVTKQLNEYMMEILEC